MKKTIYFLVLFIFSFIASLYANPSLKIQGENYQISPLTQGTKIFMNRSNMSLQAIPEEYSGWKTIRINANSSYLPGPKVSYKVKPDTDGFIFVMVANIENPEECATWAKDNEWTLIDGQSLRFANGKAEVFSFYKKACIKDQWIDVIQPNVFSGAIIVAPDIQEDLNTILATPVSIKAFGSMETDILNNGTLIYSNRNYILGGVHNDIKGLTFTRYAGGNSPSLEITAKETGEMYIAVANGDSSYDLEGNEWEEVKDYKFNYNDPDNTHFNTYKKNVKQDDVITIKTTAWQGILVLSTKIEYTVINNFTPPPGVVVHNSKASTHKYVGSPSIVELKDGTYLASHDYFGGIISDAFIYKSTDKGKSWEQVAKINTMNWGKLFLHKNDVYFMGVAPKGSMGYGNVVIMKSVDGGNTWTTPSNNKSGLLLNGFYHTAPTPVVFHDGKIWKAMEDQGQVGGWGDFSAFMMSADQDADLLDAASWKITNKIKFNPAHLNGSTAWLEGNAVIAKDNTVKNVLRLHYQPDDKVAIMDVAADGKTISFNPATGFATFPGSCKKFSIQYDEISERYWTLSNYVLEADRNSDNGGTRNTIVLAWSKDLYNWNIKDTLLHHPDRHTHGFQYLDWAFDGSDIIAVSRTAWEDETGLPPRQHDANYLTFHRFKNFRYERGSELNGVKVKTWYKNKKSALALTFDDGFEAHYQYAYPVLKEYGIDATFFINSSKVVNKGKPAIERYGFWEDFKEMSDNGHEIASHSLTHPNLSSIGYEQLIDELQKDKENIEANIGELCLTHAYPYCIHNEIVDNVASSIFIAARQCGSLHNNPSLKDKEWFSVNSDLLGWIYPRSLQNENTSINKFITKIQNDIIKTKKFGVACIHEVLPFNLLSTSDTYEVATTEWLTGICEFLKEKQESGDIWATTFSNIVRYIQERDNLRINKTVISNSELKYEFSTLLESDIYNHPLTINIAAPEGWEKVICEVWENGQLVYTNQYNMNSDNIDLDIIPDKQSVILKKQSGITSVTSSNNDIEKIICFPNPVRNILNIQSSLLIEYGIYKIFNEKGVCIKRDIYKSTNNDSFSVNVESLVAGMYLITIENEGKTYSSKFYKQD